MSWRVLSEGCAVRRPIELGLYWIYTLKRSSFEGRPQKTPFVEQSANFRDACHRGCQGARLRPLTQTARLEGRGSFARALHFEFEMTAVDAAGDIRIAGDPQAAAQGLDRHNVMPALVAGALANCTLGEMVQAMADIYGRYTGGPEW